ncbi:MAG: D-alanyl-D-alanine carboxypeptidase, partial [Methylobacterium sp.]|nr:D-alanyl-D-alanine carboxypeptidase [Methylobacterium sp.]
AKIAEARKTKLEAANAKREASRLAKPAANGKGVVPATASAYAPVETTPVIAGGARSSAKVDTGKKPAAKTAAKPAHKAPEKPAAKAADKSAVKPAAKPAKSAAKASGTSKTSAARSAED